MMKKKQEEREKDDGTSASFALSPVSCILAHLPFRNRQSTMEQSYD
jgi:hypothetical protein